MIVIVRVFSIEVARVIEFRKVKWLVHVAHLVNDVALVIQLYDKRICILSQ